MLSLPGFIPLTTTAITDLLQLMPGKLPSQEPMDWLKATHRLIILPSEPKLPTAKDKGKVPFQGKHVVLPSARDVKILNDLCSQQLQCNEAVLAVLRELLDRGELSTDIAALQLRMQEASAVNLAVKEAGGTPDWSEYDKFKGFSIRVRNRH